MAQMLLYRLMLHVVRYPVWMLVRRDEETRHLFGHTTILTAKTRQLGALWATCRKGGVT